VRRTGRVAAATVLLMGAAGLLTSPAQGLQAPVAFTSTAVSTYQTNGVAWALAQAGGLVFVGGQFTSVRPPGAAAGTDEETRTNLAVFDAATGKPTDCAPAVTRATGSIVRALSVSPDGRTLYLGGLFTAVDGTARTNLAAVDIATCTVVDTFKPAPSSAVRALAATDSAVYVGGEFTNVGGTTRQRAAAVAPVTGALLPWAPTMDKSWVDALAVSPDGARVALGGDFDTVNGSDSNALAVVDAGTGATVKAYPGFIESRSALKVLTSDGTSFYAGAEGTGGGAFDGRIAIDWSTLNERWRNKCLGATQALVVYRSLLYAGSHAHDCSVIGGFPDGARHYLSAESTASGPSLQGWWPDTNGGIGEKVGPRAMTVASAGGNDYLWVAGEFTTVNGVAQQGITRFGQSDNSARPDTSQLSVTSFRAGQVQVAWKPSSDTDDAKLTYRVYRDGGTDPVYTTTSSAPWWKRTQLTWTDTQTAGTTHTYRVTASDGINPEVAGGSRGTTVATKDSAYANAVLADNPGIYWRYDEVTGLVLADSSGHNQNANGRGGAYGVAGALSGDASKAVTLSGTTSQIWAENRIAPPANSTYSLETWVKTTTGSGGLLFGFGSKKDGYDSLNNDKVVYLTNSGQVVFGVAPTPGVPQTVRSTASVNDGAWHHVVATQGPDGMNLYVDGVSVGSNNVTTSQSGVTGFWHVGGDLIQYSWPDFPFSKYLAGSFDETAIYSKVLPAATVASHYSLSGRH
jgi:concanavalin A-like lectin/glucanase superfamily protein